MTPLHCLKMAFYPVSYLKWVFLQILSPEIIPNGPLVPHELQKRQWTYIQTDIRAIAIITGRKSGKNGDFRLIFDLLISRGLARRKDLSDFSKILT